MLSPKLEEKFQMEITEAPLFGAFTFRLGKELTHKSLAQLNRDWIFIWITRISKCLEEIVSFILQGLNQSLMRDQDK